MRPSHVDMRVLLLTHQNRACRCHVCAGCRQKLMSRGLKQTAYACLLGWRLRSRVDDCADHVGQHAFTSKCRGNVYKSRNIPSPWPGNNNQAYHHSQQSLVYTSKDITGESLDFVHPTRDPSPTRLQDKHGTTTKKPRSCPQPIALARAKRRRRILHQPNQCQQWHLLNHFFDLCFPISGQRMLVRRTTPNHQHRRRNAS
jgi:hypothetical protein